MALAAQCSPEGSRTNSFSRSISHLQSDQRSSSWLPEPSNGSTGPLLYVNFNQDYGCFACGTENGFRIYNCDPFKETFRREFDEEGGLASSSSPKRTELDGNGIGIVEMLFRSNISALVGGGKSPRYLPNKVMVWDDNQSRCIGELLFRSEVRAVKLRRDRIVVVLEHKIYVYNFSDLKLLHQIETFANRKGICAVCPASSMFVLACPGLRGGEVRLELYSSKKTRFVQAHDSPLACLALSQDGSLLATASTKGTLVRIFSTNDGTKLQELRRGADRATIFSLAFSVNCQWLVLSSDKCTVHVFSLRSSIPSSNSMTASSLLSFGSSNTGSSLSFVKGVLPRYFSSEWSFAQFRLPENTKAIVAFGPQKNTVIIVCSNGSYYRCTYDPHLGGDMIEQEFARFVNTDE